MREKSLAIVGWIPKAKVMTGKATAPPPSEVAPAMTAPKTMVTERRYRSAKKEKKLCLMARLHLMTKKFQFSLFFTWNNLSVKFLGKASAKQ
jgi:hypothetical protein